jgi:hypothetical protein
VRSLRLGIFISVLLLISSAFADVVVLKNGEVLKGKLIYQKGKTIVFEHKGQRRELKAEEISFIEFLSDKIVEISINGKTIKGVEIGVKDGKAIVKTALGQKVVEISNIKEVKDEDSTTTTNIIILTNIIPVTNYIEITNDVSNTELPPKPEEITNKPETEKTSINSSKTREITPSIYLENGIILFNQFYSYSANFRFESSYKNILASFTLGKSGEFLNFSLGLGYRILENFFVKDTNFDIKFNIGAIEKNLISTPYAGIEAKAGVKFDFLKFYILLKTSLTFNGEVIILGSVGIGL